MSNTLIIDSLNTLFSMSNTAVLGAQEQFVAFMNPAAQELFRGDRTNHKLSELLPAHITQAAATEFVTSATIEKRHVIISVTSFGAFRLFSLVPQDENVLRAGAQFAPFLASLNAFRALTTYFSDYAMQLSDVRFRRNAAELTQFYYRLLRFTLNASTASGLSDGTLAFIPQLCDLGKECRALLDNIQPITDANGIVLEVSIPDEPINCALDTALIQRMLLNILANCTERCKHGDRIRFTVTQEGEHADEARDDLHPAACDRRGFFRPEQQQLRPDGRARHCGKTQRHHSAREQRMGRNHVPRCAQHGAAGDESLPRAESTVCPRAGRSHFDLPVRPDAGSGAVSNANSKWRAAQNRAARRLFTRSSGNAHAASPARARRHQAPATGKRPRCHTALRSHRAPPSGTPRPRGQTCG